MGRRRKITESELKQKLADILCVDSVDGLLWNYEPRNFKSGDKVICIKSNRNPYANEEIIFGQEYTVASYWQGNLYVKGYLKLEYCRVSWDDDSFELKKEVEIIDTTYEDVTNQNLLQI